MRCASSLKVAIHLSATTRWGEPRQVPFPTVQQVNLPACSLHCPLMLSVMWGSCEYGFYSRWFDPTRNQTGVYISRRERSNHVLAILCKTDIFSQYRDPNHRVPDAETRM